MSTQINIYVGLPTKIREMSNLHFLFSKNESDFLGYFI